MSSTTPLDYSELLARARRCVPAISPEELQRLIAGGDRVVLVDVRERDELVTGRIPGAISVPRSVLEARIAAEVPDLHAKMIVYCAGGVRSALAAMTLADLGYTRVARVDPGFTLWQQLGYPVDAPGALTQAQRARYARHLSLPEVGEAGQLKLIHSRVLLVGAGGLGSPAALYLAAAGVGTLGVVDPDSVEVCNLQRQIIHASSRVGGSKVSSVAHAVGDLNPEVTVVAHCERLTGANVARLFGDYDVVIDGSDNFDTRYLVSDAGVRMGKPVVHGSISRFEGQVTTFVSAEAAARYGVPEGPCYRCLFPTSPPIHLAASCGDLGVLGVVCGVIGALQATEALKIVLGRGELLIGRVLTFDSLKLRFRELRLPRAEGCAACGSGAVAGN